MIKGYITLKEASSISGKEVEALKKQCQDGRIRGAIKQGKTWFVPYSEIIVDTRVGNATLGFMLNFIEAAGAGSSFGVTLIVNGTFIQGDLITKKEYIQKFKNDLVENASFKSDSTEFHNFIKTYFTEIEEMKEEGTPSFVHLKNIATSQIGGGDILKNSYLRIKYEAIDGFLMGNTRQKDDGIHG